jgi:hypothetical protein
VKKFLILFAIVVVPAIAQAQERKKAPQPKQPTPATTTSISPSTTQATPITTQAPPTIASIQAPNTQSVPKSSAGPTTAGQWNLRTIVDPMSDATRGIAATPADENIRIVVKCDSNGDSSMYFSFISSDYLGEGRYGRRDFSYRIDGSAVRTMSASHDARTASVFDLTPNSAGARFLKELSNASSFTVQLTSYDYKSYVSVINVTGAREAFNHVVKTCKDTSMERFLAQ